MATFFGEVVHSTSRAVDDDEEDEECEEVTLARVRWTPLVRAELLKSEDGKVPCKFMIIAIGAAASGFVESHILSAEYAIIGAMFSGLKDRDVNTFSQRSPTDKTCYIYRSRRIPDFLICLCNAEVLPEQAQSWTNQIFSVINADQCYLTILSTTMVAQYRSDLPVSEIATPFLRGLKTQQYPGTPLCPYLEQPNVIGGLPAQLLTYSQMKEIKAVLYMCYTDSIYLDYHSMKAFLPILKTTPIKDIIIVNRTSEEKMRELVKLHGVHNTLYL